MENKIKIEETLNLIVWAKHFYSEVCVSVKNGEVYEFNVDPKDKWVDWFVKSSAKGFNNFFLLDRCKRLPGEKCFKLCGTIEKNESNHFAIGTHLNWTCKKDGILHFFANDSQMKKYYKNNKGFITLKITRIE